MSSERDLKTTLTRMFGASVLSSTLVAAPLAVDLESGHVGAPVVWAKDGGESGEGGDSGEGGESGDSGEGGESGEGGDSGGSGESGESGDSGESGESGDSGGSSESGNRGKSSNSGKGSSRSRSANRSIPSRFGHVVQSRKTATGFEVRYSDGWKETVRSGRYTLSDARGRTVVSRRARRSDIQRLGASRQKPQTLFSIIRDRMRNSDR